jgi:hypothetical protein
MSYSERCRPRSTRPLALANGSPTGVSRRRGANYQEREPGFSISEMLLPAVGVNGKDWIGASVFTMLHEFSRIIIRNGGVCDLGDDAVEVFCNGWLVPPRLSLRSTCSGSPSSQRPEIAKHGLTVT